MPPQVAGGGEGADPLRPHHVVRHVQQPQRGVDAQHLGQQRNAWGKETQSGEVTETESVGRNAWEKGGAR